MSRFDEELAKFAVFWIVVSVAYFLAVAAVVIGVVAWVFAQ